MNEVSNTAECQKEKPYRTIDIETWPTVRAATQLDTLHLIDWRICYSFSVPYLVRMVHSHCRLSTKTYTYQLMN